MIYDNLLDGVLNKLTETPLLQEDKNNELYEMIGGVA